MRRRGNVTVWRGGQPFMFSDASVSIRDIYVVVKKERTETVFGSWDRYEIVYDTGARV